jgi:O-antigen/teichoic acid export membrane protein
LKITNNLKNAGQPVDLGGLYSQIALGTFTGLVHSGVMLLVGILLPPLILQHLDNTGYGYWVLFVSLASYLNLFEMGLTIGLTKVWAERYKTSEISKVKAAFRTVFLFFICAGLLGLCLSWVVALGLPDTLGLLPYFVFGTAIALWGEPFAGVLRGQQKTDWVNLTNAMAALLKASLVYWLLVAGWGLQAMALALVLSNTGRLFAFILLVRRLLPTFKPIERGPLEPIWGMLKLGATQQITQIWGVVISPTNRVILFGILGAPILASYDLGSRLVAGAALIPAIMLPPLLPAFSYLSSANDREGIRDVLLRANKYVNILGMPFFWFIMIFAGPLTTAWLGRPAPEVTLTARILMVGAYINLLTGPFTQALIGMGRPKLCIKKVIVGALFGLVLPVGLALVAGLKGFLMGESLAAALPALIFLQKFQRQEGIQVVREINSTVIRSSTLLVPLTAVLLFFYTVTHEFMLWQRLWVWAVVFVFFFGASIFIYRKARMVDDKEMWKIYRLFGLKQAATGIG